MKNQIEKCSPRNLLWSIRFWYSIVIWRPVFFFVLLLLLLLRLIILLNQDQNKRFHLWQLSRFFWYSLSNAQSEQNKWFHLWQLSRFFWYYLANAQSSNLFSVELKSLLKIVKSDWKVLASKSLMAHSFLILHCNLEIFFFCTSKYTIFVFFLQFSPCVFFAPHWTPARI